MKVGKAKPIDAFATRVPVWRGHTITLSVRRAYDAECVAVANILAGATGIAVTKLPMQRDHFPPDAPMATVIRLRNSSDGVMMVLKRDNLGPAKVNPCNNDTL